MEQRIIKFNDQLLGWLFPQNKSYSSDKRRELSMLIWAVLVTAVVMWSYAFNCYITVENAKIKYLGFFYATVHLCSPLLYRFIPSISFCLNTFLIAGFLFQFQHAQVTGGIFSSTCIWFSILPLLAGVVGNRKDILLWTFVALGGIGYLFFDVRETLFPRSMSDLGILWSQLNISVGYILLNSLSIWLYSSFRDRSREELNQHREELSTLLKIVGHDISNPLNVILGNVHLYKKKIKDSPGLTRVLAIERASESIREIVKHVNNREAITTGKSDTTLVAISLNDIVLNLDFMFAAKLAEKNITIEYDTQNNSSVYILGNPILVKNQIFNNLISNSLKFMDPDGKIKITVFSNHEFFEIIYKDTGVGMSQDLCDNLFKYDVKTSKKGLSGEVGTGFGMPLLKTSIEKCGGNVRVESLEKEKSPSNHGTTFYLNFLRADIDAKKAV